MTRICALCLIFIFALGGIGFAQDTGGKASAPAYVGIDKDAFGQQAEPVWGDGGRYRDHDRYERRKYYRHRYHHRYRGDDDDHYYYRHRHHHRHHDNDDDFAKGIVAGAIILGIAHEISD